MKIFLNGSTGRLNKTLITYAKKHDISICTGGVNPRENPVPGVSEADAIIDFSFHTATIPLLKIAQEHKKPVVIATTGHTSEERTQILAFTKSIPIVWADNCALAVNVFFHLVEEAAKFLGNDFDPEIIEMHHALKKDAPGGTAKKLAKIIQEGMNLENAHIAHGREGITTQGRLSNEIGMHALRCSANKGEHMVYFCGPGERIEIIHRTEEKSTFAKGAFSAAKWLLNKPAGLYTMSEVLGIK